MYLFHNPPILENIFPQITWKVKTEKKILYLSFDDGPDPAMTPFVLDTLRRYEAKATFFCVGKMALSERTLLDQMRTEGHTIGNHSFSHLNGWRTNVQDYLEDVEKCNMVFKSSLFRPPYGKIKPSQLSALSKKYRVVMWDVLSGDFDPLLSVKKCREKIIRYAEKGSIIVFHDTISSSGRLIHTLPDILDYYARKGFIFKAIPE